MRPRAFPLYTSCMQVETLAQEAPQPQFTPLGASLKVLLVWPRFPPSFWGFEGLLDMIPEDSASPPLGLITVAALCPPSWTLRLLDHALEEIRDEDYLWADLIMVSAMHAQRADTAAILARARQLGRRTFIGGPWASSEPDLLHAMADHVLVGEAEEVFARIAAELEAGTARSLYRVDEKPDVSCSPIPRYDLLQLDKYTLMSVQFSRGCPFQCEFCDIITIYGRKPRTKS
ncbi:MAG TPA: cobalamin-dependent protein, partial [Acidobacteriaceae bacterium]|nr:cobalamin-dependent protein [Acidobacteriaceae bacterium]